MNPRSKNSNPFSLYQEYDLADGAYGNDDGVINGIGLEQNENVLNKTQSNQEYNLNDGAHGNDDGAINGEDFKQDNTELNNNSSEKENLNNDPTKSFASAIENNNKESINLDDLYLEYNEISLKISKYINETDKNFKNKKEEELRHRARLIEEKNNLSKEDQYKFGKEYDLKIAESEERIRTLTNISEERKSALFEEREFLFKVIGTTVKKLEENLFELNVKNRRLEFDLREMAYSRQTDYIKYNELNKNIKDNKHIIEEISLLIEKYKAEKQRLYDNTDYLFRYNSDIENILNTPKTESATEKKEQPKNNDYSSNNLFDKIKDSLDESMTNEQLSNLVSNLQKLMMLKFDEDQNKFEEDLKNKKTVEEKIKRISEREKEIEDYKKLFSSENNKIDVVLKKGYETIKNDISQKFLSAKEKGEYAFKNSDSLKDSLLYINNNIRSDKDLKESFKILLENLKERVNDNKNDEQNLIENKNWTDSMNDFVNSFNLDRNKILPYINAFAKIQNPDVEIDNNFSIGEDLSKKTPSPNDGSKKSGDNNPTKDEGTQTDGKDKPENDGKKDDENSKGKENIPKKIRRKVKKVEKVSNEWFKKHPKLKIILIGLGIALGVGVGSQLIGAALMMINSSLWHALPFARTTLHSANLFLSKIVGLGKWKYISESGLYKLGGNVGALSLYKSAGAYLTSALPLLGGVGIGIKKIIDSRIKDNVKDLEEKGKAREEKQRKKLEKQNEKENNYMDQRDNEIDSKFSRFIEKIKKEYNLSDKEALELIQKKMSSTFDNNPVEESKSIPQKDENEAELNQEETKIHNL